MNKERLRELAGIKKAIGEVNFILNESTDARTYVRGLSIYKDLMKDKKAKPAALKAATQFVKDFGKDPINVKAKKWIQNELSDVASEHNPGGAMVDNEDRKMPEPKAGAGKGDSIPRLGNDKESKAARKNKAESDKIRKEKEEANKNKRNSGKLAKEWLLKNPNATAKEFNQAAIKFGMNPGSTRSAFYRIKKKLKTNEAYSIRLDNKFLGERSHPFNPNWLAEDDYSDEYLILDSLKEAERIRDSLLLHTKGKMEIINLFDEC
jgi:hypothetical protein